MLAGALRVRDPQGAANWHTSCFKTRLGRDVAQENDLKGMP
ncbi:hypothetical protein C8J31_106237 [Rhizobium sp. PP-CC-2G-626]|nr:hypothetical protein C8J31_106237 [Rhizobium sp. PP-CC-2G-626]